MWSHGIVIVVLVGFVTAIPIPTTPTHACTHKYINQDISIVWEVSSSTGSFVVSDNVNLFLQNLVPQISGNLADPMDITWSSVTNLSLVEFPNPANYGDIGEFGTIRSNTLSGVLAVIQVLGFNPSNTMSDINSGSGVGEATATATQLKNNGITILTVAAVTKPGATIPLSDLSSGANFEFILNTTNMPEYREVAKQIVQTLASISTQCCLNTDCSPNA